MTKDFHLTLATLLLMGASLPAYAGNIFEVENQTNKSRSVILNCSIADTEEQRASKPVVIPANNTHMFTEADFSMKDPTSPQLHSLQVYADDGSFEIAPCWLFANIYVGPYINELGEVPLGSKLVLKTSTTAPELYFTQPGYDKPDGLTMVPGEDVGKLIQPIIFPILSPFKYIKKPTI